jgi:hypothetical protein
MIELVSISEAARRTGRDFRTVHKIIHLAEIKVTTRTGNLYDLNQISALLNHNTGTRTDRATKMVAL